jgi:hypothetical protein
MTPKNIKANKFFNKFRPSFILIRRISFTWFKTLDKNTYINSENLSINSVKETDFDIYTCEAIFIKNDTLYNIYFSDYREPITLEKDETLSTENPENRIIAIYPNPTKDFINIKIKTIKLNL